MKWQDIKLETKQKEKDIYPNRKAKKRKRKRTPMRKLWNDRNKWRNMKCDGDAWNGSDTCTYIPCCPVLNVTRVFFRSCSTTKGLNDDVSITENTECSAQFHENERRIKVICGERRERKRIKMEEKWQEESRKHKNRRLEKGARRRQHWVGN